MAKKKKASRPRPAAGLAALRRRVATLETDVHSLRDDMGSLSTEVSGLKTTVEQVDARTKRGERLMNEMQGEQRRASRMIDAIARKWDIAVEPPVPPSAEPGPDELPPDADEPE